MVVDGATPRLKTGNCSLRICGVSGTEASITAPANPRYFIAAAIIESTRFIRSVLGYL
jgi:hypothetical protein